jgi:hypothetical protein
VYNQQKQISTTSYIRVMNNYKDSFVGPNSTTTYEGKMFYWINIKKTDWRPLQLQAKEEGHPFPILPNKVPATSKNFLALVNEWKKLLDEQSSSGPGGPSTP